MLGFRGLLQYNQEDCGAACLASILKYYGKNISISQLRNDLEYGSEGATLLGLTSIASKYQLVGETLFGDLEDFILGIERKEILLPVIMHFKLQDGRGHFVIVWKIKNKKIYYFDPSFGNKSVSFEIFQVKWTGYLIHFRKTEFWEKKSIPINKFNIIVSGINSNRLIFVKILMLSAFIMIISFGISYSFKFLFDGFINPQIIESNSFNKLELQFFGKREHLIIYILSLLIIQFILNLLRGYYYAVLFKKMVYQISKNFINQLMYALPSKLVNFSLGDIVLRFQSINTIVESFVSLLLTCLLQSICSFIGAILLFQISKQLFVILCLSLVLYFFIVLMFIPKLNRYEKKYQSIFSETLTMFSNTLTGIMEIKVMNRQNFIESKLNKLILRCENYRTLHLKFSEYLKSSVAFIESVGNILILLYGIFLIKTGQLTIGELISFQSLTIFFAGPIKDLLLIQDDFQKMNILISRINDLMVIETENLTSHLKSPIDSAHNFPIGLKGISYAKGFSAKILNDINLTINENEKIAVVGLNGSGKSTLLNIIANINEISEGNYLINNQEINLVSLKSFRDEISFVVQNPYIFSGTVLENIIFDFKGTYDLNYLIKICQLFDIDIENKSPFSLNAFVVENAKNISNGQRQKIGLARALLKKPKLLIMDEATCHLDNNVEDKLYDFFKNNCQSLTIINVIHNKSLLNYFTKVLVVDKGRIEFFGDISEAYVKSKVFGKLFS